MQVAAWCKGYSMEYVGWEAPSGAGAHITITRKSHLLIFSYTGSEPLHSKEPLGPR